MKLKLETNAKQILLADKFVKYKASSKRNYVNQ